MAEKQNSNSNKKTRKSSAIVVLWIVAVSAVLITCIFVCANVFIIIPNNTQAFTTELISAALSIVGLAVAVWAGLNIVNAIERKDFEELKDNINELTSKSESLKTEIEETKEKANPVLKTLKEIKNKQLSSDKVKLLNEMYNTVQDISTRVLIEKIGKLENTTNINFSELLEVERRFSNVYYLHSSEYSYDEGLLKEAYEGVLLSEKILNKENVDIVIQLYLKYRIAEFCFYSGYCCSYSEREKYFIKAIEIYQSICDFFGAQLPVYEENQNYPKINYKKCGKEKAKISAYFCNSIGEAYSKIVQIKDSILATDTKINEYSLKAVFYCAYASYWDEKETYLRNLGCSIERHCGVTNGTYDELSKIYQKALEINATLNAFKVLLSASDKFINHHLEIKNVDIKKGRETPFSDELYFENWQKTDQTTKSKLLSVLSTICDKSKCAKTIYPSNEVGYIYSCIYHRDMCLINGNNKDIAKQHYSKAIEDLTILKVINPKGALTKILSDDLDALS